MTDIILSIKPQWWEKILSGEKNLEIRKSAPKQEGPFRVFCYVSGTKSIKGYIIVDEIIGNLTPEGVLAAGNSCVPKEDLEAYAAGKPLFAWKITKAAAFPFPKELKSRPPMSWKYAK